MAAVAAAAAATSGADVAGAVEVIEDQSALVRAQERLHRLDKTAALGTMAGGIAHEIRNPLHAIQGFAELLVREADGDSRATRLASRIREGVHEIEGIVAGMLGIAGDGDLHLEEFDFGDLDFGDMKFELHSEDGEPFIWRYHLDREHGDEDEDEDEDGDEGDTAAGIAIGL